MKKLLFVFAVFCMGSAAFAQSIVTDRPDQTEASSTVGEGVLQIESGFTFMTEDIQAEPNIDGANPFTLETYALPNTLFRIGITPRFELRIVTQPELQRVKFFGCETSRSFGLADLEVGFKANILKERNGRPEVGFLTHLVLPSGTDGLSNQKAGVINKLAVTHSLSESHTLAWNLGYDYLGTGNGDLFYSLSWGISLSDKVGVYLEPYGFFENLEDLVFNADAGFTYLISNDIQFDYSFGVGLNHEMNYHSTGLSLRLGN